MDKAILYAAGVGRRLEQKYGNLPKILLPFGQRTLLEWHVRRLTAQGFKRLTLVLGYEKEQVEQEAIRLAARYPIQIESLVNPHYTEGSVLSFGVSLPVLEVARQPLLLLDGDVLYPETMIERLTHSSHACALLVDRDYSTADEDPVLVPVVQGRPLDFVKGWRGEAEWVGESVGLFKVGVEDLGMLIAETRVRLQGKGRADSYDDVLRAMVRAGRFGCEEVTGIPWTEIDFPKDVERAENVILPAIRSMEGAERAT